MNTPKSDDDTTNSNGSSPHDKTWKESLNSSEIYVFNCKRYDIPIDPSIVIALKTRWDKMMPSRTFGEGAMLALQEVLPQNDHIRKLTLASASMWESRLRGNGNGNSNARILSSILEENKTIEDLDLTDTGLDDDGIIEICNAIEKNKSITKLNLSRNLFTEIGAKKLRESLSKNSSLKELDLSRNALGFQSIYEIECSCLVSGLILSTTGNYVSEEIMNAVSHCIGFLFSIVGTTLITSVAIEKGTDYHYWSAVLFSFANMFLYLSSTLYHSFFMLPSASGVLQICDHVGIYFLIAGSYTPFMFIGLYHDTNAQFMLIGQWTLALIGSIVAATSNLNSMVTNILECAIFLLMGFACLLLWPAMLLSLPPECLYLLLIGGCTYAFGVIFYIMGVYKPIYHVIWHVFVLFASSLIWFAVYFYVMPMDIDVNQISNESSYEVYEQFLKKVGIGFFSLS